MPGKFLVSLTYAKDDTDRATVAFVVANAAVASDKEAVVFLSTEGVRLSEKGYADDIHEEGFAALKDLMTSFANAGGTIYVCSPCFKKRGLDQNIRGGDHGDAREADALEAFARPAIAIVDDARHARLGEHFVHRVEP